MWLNLQFHADLVTFTEEILNGKLHFLCGVSGSTPVIKFHETCLLQVQNSYLTSHSWYLWSNTVYLQNIARQQEHENIQGQKLHDFFFCSLLSYVALCQHEMFVGSLFLINLEQVRVFRMLFKLVKTSFPALNKSQYIDWQYTVFSLYDRNSFVKNCYVILPSRKSS